MKKLFSILMLVGLMLTTATAQKLNYQLVIRNNNQQLVTNQAVTANVVVKVDNISVYDTTINATTNSQGLLDIYFGNPTFLTIEWPKATLSVMVQDSTSSVVYMPHADLQVSAVPYALYSANGGSGLYFLTFNANTGTGSMNAQIFPVGVNQDVMYNGFTKPGYTFTGWNTSAAGDGTAYTEGQSTVLTENTLVYAQWTVNHYTVSFHSNGAEGTMPNQDFTYGIAQNLATCTMNKVGYHFAGWNTSANGSGTTYADQYTLSATDNLDLYAQWAPDAYTVAFIANNGTNDTTYQTYYRDQAQTLTPNSFVYAGHNFADWNTAADGTGTGYLNQQQLTLTENLVLYARWTTIPTFHVIFNANGGDGEMPDQIFVQGEAQALNSNLFTRTGCNFMGWNTNANGMGTFYSDGQSITIATTTTLYAKWDGSSLVNDTMPTFCTVGAIRSNETGTGNQISAVRDHQMNSYRVVQIGDQCWLKENMRATTSPSTGTDILQCPAVNTSFTGKRAYYPKDSASVAARMGVYYNWNAAMDTFNTTYGETSYGTYSGNAVKMDSVSNRRGICPEGWHVPNKLEWNKMLTAAGVTTANGAGKLAGGNDWKTYTPVADDDDGDQPGNYSYALRNQSGFSAVPAGCCDLTYLGYVSYGNSANFWSTPFGSGYYAWSCVLAYDNAEVFRDTKQKNDGYSVRCVRDYQIIACPGAETVSDYDGNQYSTVQIGDQCWMKENLRTTHYSDGTLVELGNSISTTTAYRYYPNNDTNNVLTYGYMYNWKAVMGNSSSTESNPSGVQGICPMGWHVPSDAEWMQLTTYVRSQPSLSCARCEATDYDYITYCIAKALASTTGWNSSSNSCDVGSNPGSNNATGFSAVPAGRYNGSYGDFGNRLYCWSATQYVSSNAYFHYLDYNGTHVAVSSSDKSSGYSVRCVRD